MAGTDQGTAWSGYTDDFSWGVLSLSAGASLVLQDGNDTPGSAQYVRELLLADGLGQIADITGNGLNLYYDPTKSSNDYLLGQSYPLADGGMLIPVPEPGTLALLAAAIVCLAGFVRRGVRKG